MSARGKGKRSKVKKADVAAMLAATKARQEAREQANLGHYVQSLHKEHQKASSERAKEAHSMIVDRMRDHLAERKVQEREMLQEEEKLMQRYAEVQRVLQVAKEKVEEAQPLESESLASRAPFRSGASKEPIFDPKMPHDFQRSVESSDTGRDDDGAEEFSDWWQEQDESWLDDEEGVADEADGQESQQEDEQVDEELDVWSRLSGVKTTHSMQSSKGSPRKEVVDDERVRLAQEAARIRIRERKEKLAAQEQSR